MLFIYRFLGAIGTFFNEQLRCLGSIDIVGMPLKYIRKHNVTKRVLKNKARVLIEFNNKQKLKTNYLATLSFRLLNHIQVLCYKPQLQSL